MIERSQHPLLQCAVLGNMKRLFNIIPSLSLKINLKFDYNKYFRLFWAPLDN
jgi:hypothetical protein